MHHAMKQLQKRQQGVPMIVWPVIFSFNPVAPHVQSDDITAPAKSYRGSPRRLEKRGYPPRAPICILHRMYYRNVISNIALFIILPEINVTPPSVVIAGVVYARLARTNNAVKAPLESPAVVELLLIVHD